MIKLNSLNLEALSFKKTEHISIVRELKENEGVKKYISSRFYSWVQEPNSDNKYETGKAYVIYDNNNIVGMCGSSIIDLCGIVDMWIVVSESERGKKYGQKITIELIPYLIENIEGLKDIRLMVNRCNYASNQNAIKSGYKLVKKYSDSNEYRYFGR